MEPKIKTYRTLSNSEIEVMNALKDGEDAAMRTLNSALENAPMADKRAMALAKTNIQQGFMWATRAVARPSEVEE